MKIFTTNIPNVKFVKVIDVKNDNMKIKIKHEIKKNCIMKKRQRNTTQPQ